MSKRQELQDRRRQAARRQRLVVVGIVAGVIVIVAGVLLYQNIRNNQSAGSLAQITPAAHPQANGLHLGDPGAPVKIDVWEDFQCSACYNYTQTTEPGVIDNLVDTGKAYYTYHFFFTIDRGSTGESHQAANAAMCANEQGRFWDYHDSLIANYLGENVGSFTDTRLVQMAKNLHLDMTAFNTCFQANRYKSVIDQDVSAGAAKGVAGTPSVFVNGTILTPGYVPTYDQIAQAVAAAGGK